MRSVIRRDEFEEVARKEGELSGDILEKYAGSESSELTDAT